MVKLAGAQEHPLANKYPTRAPVWWARTGPVGKDPNLVGVSGRNIVLRIPKQFNRLEKFLARILRAPHEVRRPLDAMNSLLWELCDGSRTFSEVCHIMDDVFGEEVSPAIQRTSAAIALFQSTNLLLLLDDPLNERWRIGPGCVPDHQTLMEGGLREGDDTHPLPGEAT